MFGVLVGVSIGVGEGSGVNVGVGVADGGIGVGVAGGRGVSDGFGSGELVDSVVALGRGGAATVAAATTAGAGDGGASPTTGAGGAADIGVAALTARAVRVTGGVDAAPATPCCDIGVAEGDTAFDRAALTAGVRVTAGVRDGAVSFCFIAPVAAGRSPSSPPSELAAISPPAPPIMVAAINTAAAICTFLRTGRAMAPDRSAPATAPIPRAGHASGIRSVDHDRPRGAYAESASNSAGTISDALSAMA